MTPTGGGRRPACRDWDEAGVRLTIPGFVYATPARSQRQYYFLPSLPGGVNACRGYRGSHSGSVVDDPGGQLRNVQISGRAASP